MANDEHKWAIIELMGHQKIAGRYSEHGPMHRVDVPDDNDEFHFSRLYSPQAIYSITFVDEQAAKIAAKALETPAIAIWEVNRELRRLAAPVEARETVEADDYERDFDEDEIQF